MGTDLLIYYKQEWERYISSMVKVDRMFNYLVWIFNFFCYYIFLLIIYSFFIFTESSLD